jgi:hypothetical protein
MNSEPTNRSLKKIDSEPTNIYYTGNNYFMFLNIIMDLTHW